MPGETMVQMICYALQAFNPADIKNGVSGVNTQLEPYGYPIRTELRPEASDFRVYLYEQFKYPGDAAISCYVFRGGGLKARYYPYAQPHLPGDNFIERTEPEINFNWTRNDFVGLGMSLKTNPNPSVHEAAFQDWMSAVYDGILYPDITANYTIYLRCTDYARLVILGRPEATITSENGVI